LGINETKFDTPTPLSGGKDFMGGIEQQNPDRLIWKSGKQVSDEYAKAIRRAHQESGGKDVLLSNVLMGEQAADFSDQTTRPIIEWMKTAPMTNEAKQQLHEAIAARIAQKAPKSPAWPGFDAMHKDSALMEDWLSKAGSGRTQLPREMELARWQAKGAPDIASIRKAVIAPNLLDKQAGMGGYSLGIADPEGRVVYDPLVKRADYDTGVGGTHFGNLPEGIPHDIMFHDYVQQMRAKNPGATAQNELYAIERAKPFQVFDHQQLERVMKYLRSKEGSKWGIGGAIGAGLITQEQAKELFGDDT
jgi:hypothetical protein